MITFDDDRGVQRCTCGQDGPLPADVPANNTWPKERTLISESNTLSIEEQLIRHAEAAAALAPKGITWQPQPLPPGPMWLEGPATVTDSKDNLLLALPTRLQFILDFHEKHGGCA